MYFILRFDERSAGPIKRVSSISRYHLVCLGEAMRSNTLTCENTVQHARSGMMPLPVTKFPVPEGNFVTGKAKLASATQLSESGEAVQRDVELLYVQ